MPPDRDPLSDAVSRLDVDPLDAAQERVREAIEQGTSAPEKRGVGRLVRDVVSEAWAAVKRLVGLP